MARSTLIPELQGVVNMSPWQGTSIHKQHKFKAWKDANWSLGNRHRKHVSQIGSSKSKLWVSARGPPWVALLRIRWNHLRQLWPSRMLSLRCRGWHWLLMMFRRLGCKSLCRVLHRVRHLLGVATRTGWWIRCSWCMLTSANISARILFGWGACIFILACNKYVSHCKPMCITTSYNICTRLTTVQVNNICHAWALPQLHSPIDHLSKLNLPSIRECLPSKSTYSSGWNLVFHQLPKSGKALSAEFPY